MRKFVMTAMAAGLASVSVVPVAAQSFSEGYEFLKAVKDRSGQEVTDALNEPGTTIVNTRDITSGETALHIVTKRRDTSWIRFLTQRGANPNIEDNKGVTPLQIASGLGLVEGVEALIAAGANINKANVTGETALLSAVHRRDLAMVRLLLENGADVDRADNSGRTARDYVELMSANTQLLDAIKRSDEKREQGANQSYGPSF